MDENTRNALEGSILKWKGIVAGTKKDKGMSNCPLCKMFNGEDAKAECDGCPVSERSGFVGCTMTPYTKWHDLFDGPFPHAADTDEKRAAAQEELEFLVSLRS